MQFRKIGFGQHFSGRRIDRSLSEQRRVDDVRAADRHLDATALNLTAIGGQVRISGVKISK
jgi:hypothetical protein